MTMLIINKDSRKTIKDAGCCEYVEVGTLKKWIRTFTLLRRIRRYEICEVWVSSCRNFNRPFVLALIARIVSRRNCVVKDDDGNVIDVGLLYILKQGAAAVVDFISVPFELFVSLIQLRKIKKNGASCRSLLNRSGNVVVYLKTDLPTGSQVGGSVTHTAGVVNSLKKEELLVKYISFEGNPLLNDTIQDKIVDLGQRYRNTPEIRSLYCNRVISAFVNGCLDDDVRFVYQRYCLNNYSGLELSQRLGVPFVLEFNGSEVWISKNWGNGRISYEPLARRIEAINLRYADLIVVVSEAQADILIADGVDSNKILVNPNGVDSNVFHPDVDGEPIRNKYDLENCVVIGFVGTFGVWHGVSVLIKAVHRLVDRREDLRRRLKVLMVGTGLTWQEAVDYVSDNDLSEYFIFSGEVPQNQSRYYMAACDILVCCNVPNPDGSRFFGSPTKLFEYMSMGRAVVVSDLEQIGTIVRNHQAGLVTRPGEAMDLSHALESLVDSDETRRLYAANARKAVVDQYNWDMHTRNILRKLDEVCL